MRFALAALLCLLTVPEAASQPLPAGQWIGQLVPQATQGRAAPVQAEVTRCDSTLALTLYAQRRPEGIETTALVYEPGPGHLGFTFADPVSGQPFLCRLVRIQPGQFGGRHPAGSYTGRCFAGGAPQYALLLTPPASPGPECPVVPDEEPSGDEAAVPEDG